MISANAVDIRGHHVFFPLVCDNADMEVDSYTALLDELEKRYEKTLREWLQQFPGTDGETVVRELQWFLTALRTFIVGQEYDAQRALVLWDVASGYQTHGIQKAFDFWQIGRKEVWEWVQEGERRGDIIIGPGAKSEFEAMRERVRKLQKAEPFIRSPDPELQKKYVDFWSYHLERCKEGKGKLSENSRAFLKANGIADETFYNKFMQYRKDYPKLFEEK